MAAIIPVPNLDLTDKDFDSLVYRVNNLIDSVFPDWTSKSRADFGNILVRLFAHIGDVLGFYIDNHARESRIVTATQRRSLLGLAKLLNYTPSGATAATVDCTITLESVPSNDVEFPAGTIAKTLAVTEPIEFQLLALATIAASASPPTVTATFEHSKTHIETFPASGLADQEIYLGESPFLDDKETVSAGNGTYTKVSNFLDSTSTDRHYIVRVDATDRARIKFGSGTNGELPTGTITVTYRTGGGSLGNIQQGALQRLVGAFTDVMGSPVVPSVTNALAASGGGPRDTVAAIKQDAPASITTINRTVTREDYETNALKVTGVDRALMLTADEDTRVQENEGNLYIVPIGGGDASASLLSDVYTMVTDTYPNTLTFRVNVFSALYLTVNVEVVVYFSKGYTKSLVADQIEINLTDYFALRSADGSQNLNVGFGYNYQERGQGTGAEIPYSDIYNVVRDTYGVYKIKEGLGSLLLNNLSADVTIDLDYFPVLGTVKIIDGETGTEVS